MALALVRELVPPGVREVVAVMRANGNCPADDFLERELSKLKLTGGPDAETAEDKFLGIFEQMTMRGSLPASQFKREMKGLWTFKSEVANKQVRFPCFEDGTRWVITHGFFKPGAQKGKGNWPQKEIKKACELRDEYLARKGKRRGK